MLSYCERYVFIYPISTYQTIKLVFLLDENKNSVEQRLCME